jgi:hypothetical protein
MNLHQFIVFAFFVGPIIVGISTWLQGADGGDFARNVHMTFGFYFLASVVFAAIDLLRGRP